MLQSIRDKITGWFAAVFLGAIAIVFIFWGVNIDTGSSTRYAAQVNGEGVSLEEVRNAWRMQEQQFQQQFRGQLPEAFAKMQQENLLTMYIQIELLRQQMAEQGYRLSDAELLKTIAENPRWQTDGKFSPELYAFEARQRGLSKAGMDAEERKRVERDQLIRGIVASAFVTPVELTRREALLGEQRDVDYTLLAASDFLASIKPEAAQVQVWYDAHASEYQTPETADLEYVEMKLADIERDVPVDDAALSAYYEQVKESYTAPERRRARHILIATEGVDDAAAKKSADDVMSKLNAGGDFAVLAKQHSQDPASAESGGLLDWAARGAYVGPFEDALFAMQPGEVRGPVKTEFGYHIIKLEGTDGGQVKPFAEVRAELETEFRKQQAQGTYYERSQKLADEAFKALTELSSVATTMNLPLQSIVGFTRQGGGTLGGSPELIEAVFRPESLEKRENSALIKLDEDRVAVVRVTKHQPPQQLAIDAVRAQIEMRLKEQGAREAAAKQGNDLISKLATGAWTSVLSAAKLKPQGKRTAKRDAADVPAPVLSAAFAVPHKDLADGKVQYRGTATDDGGFAVVAVSNARPGTLALASPEGAAQMRQALEERGGKDFEAYLTTLQRAAKIERNPRVFE